MPVNPPGQNECPPGQWYNSAQGRCVSGTGPYQGGQGGWNNPPGPGDPPKPPPGPGGGGGPCPPGTPPGPASCCPGGTVWRTDTNQCEAPDARSKADQDTCDEARRPDSECTRNQQWCDFDTAQWRCDRGAPAGPGGGGPGGGGGGGGAGGGKPGVSAPGTPGFNWDRFNKLLGIGNNLADPATGWLKGVLEGGTRYSPEVMQWLAGQSKAGAEGAAVQQRDTLNEELTARGLSGGNFAVAQQQGIRERADARVGQEMTQHRVTKVNADFEDKLNAVDRMLKYVNELRSYAAQLNMTEADREKLEATIKLGYEQLKQQFQMLQMQLASNKDLLGMSLKSQETLGLLNLQFKYT